MRKIILLIILSFFSLYSFGQANTQQATQKLMLGKWISNEDPIFTLQIFKNHLVHFNKGEDDSDYFNYEVTPLPCDTTIAQRSKTGFYLSETSKEGLTTCSYIEKLTTDSLLLNYNWGARLLHFAKKK